MQEDYAPLSRVIDFQSRVTLQQISIAIINDNTVEHDESFEVFLLVGDKNVHLSPFPRAVITIKDDDDDKSKCYYAS